MLLSIIVRACVCVYVCVRVCMYASLYLSTVLSLSLSLLLIRCGGQVNAWAFTGKLEHKDEKCSLSDLTLNSFGIYESIFQSLT